MQRESEEVPAFDSTLQGKPGKARRDAPQLCPFCAVKRLTAITSQGPMSRSGKGDQVASHSWLCQVWTPWPVGPQADPCVWEGPSDPLGAVEASPQTFRSICCRGSGSPGARRVTPGVGVGGGKGTLHQSIPNIQTAKQKKPRRPQSRDCCMRLRGQPVSPLKIKAQV